VPGLVEALTARELEVLALIAAGRSNRRIAEELVVTLDTVKKHVGRVLDKLGADNRTEAVARARELGLIRQPGAGSRRDGHLVPGHARPAGTCVLDVRSAAAQSQPIDAGRPLGRRRATGADTGGDTPSPSTPIRGGASPRSHANRRAA